MEKVVIIVKTQELSPEGPGLGGLRVAGGASVGFAGQLVKGPEGLERACPQAWLPLAQRHVPDYPVACPERTLPTCGHVVGLQCPGLLQILGRSASRKITGVQMGGLGRLVPAPAGAETLAWGPAAR